MKLIDTSVVSSAVGYPGLAHNTSAQVGIDFLQQALLDMANAFALALLPIGFTYGQVFVIYGCGQVGSTINGGAIWYNGEVFLVPAQTIHGTSTPFIGSAVIANATDVGANQTVLSDGSTVSMHHQRTVIFEYNALPNMGCPLSAYIFALPDYQTWNMDIAVQTLQTQVATIITNISTMVSTYNAAIAALNTTVAALSVPPLILSSTLASIGINSTSYIQLSGLYVTTPNDGITRNYMIYFKATSQCSNGSTNSYANIRLHNITSSVFYDTTQGGKDNGTNTDVYFIGLNMLDYRTIGPNETIYVEGQDGGTNITLNYCDMRFVELK